MPRIVFSAFMISIVFCFAASAQQTAPSPSTSPGEAKANARPTPAPEAAAAEPFDKADVKTMAAKCVRLDTESGIIETEMFPESAPESVRSFLNLSAIGALDNTTFSRVVPGFGIQ